MAVNGLNYTSGNKLIFTTSDTERGLVDNSGNWGFGTLSPTNLVHISGGTDPLTISGLQSGTTDVSILSIDANGVVGTRGDIVVGGSITDNVITLTDSDSSTTDLTVDAITGLGYDGDWAISGTSTGVSAPAVELPFITSGSYDAGTITLSINGGLEPDIEITGIDGTDTFLTGVTVGSGTGVVAFELNDSGENFNATGFSFTLGSTDINLLETVDTIADMVSITSTSFVGDLDGTAADATILETSRDFSIEGDITASAQSFNGSQNVVLNATIDNGVVTNDMLAGSIANDKLVNDSVTLGSTEVVLGAAATTEIAGLSSVTATTFTGALVGNADTSSQWESGILLSLGTDLSGSVSINGSSDVTLNASLEANTVDTAQLVDGAVTTAKIADGDVTNAKLANSGFNTAGTGGSTGSIELGDTISFVSTDGSVTISDNGSGTFDIEVGDEVDTFVTGGTFSSGDLTLGLNDGTSAQTISGLWTDIPNSALVNDSVTLGSTEIELGTTVTEIDGLSSVTATTFTGALVGNASSATLLQNGRDFSISGDITASAISFDGSGNVALNASIDDDAVTTVKILDGNVTNAKLADNAVTQAKMADDSVGTDEIIDLNVTNGKLADNAVTQAKMADDSVGTDEIIDGNVTNAKLENSSINTSGTTGTGSISLGGDLKLISSDSSVVISDNGSGQFDFSLTDGEDTFVTSGAINSPADGTLRLTRNDAVNVDITGFSLSTAGDSGSNTLYLGDTLTLNGADGITTTDNGDGSFSIDLDDTAVSTGSYGDVDTVATFTVDQQGRLTAAGESSIVIVASQVSDFATSAETAIFQAGNFVDGTGIDFTVTANDSVSASLTDTGVGAASYGDNNSVASFTVDAQGRLTAASNVDIDGSQILNNTLTFEGTDASTASAALNGDITFTSLDNSVVISGNGSTIDVQVSDAAITNIYTADGTLGGNRTVTQAGNSLSFTGGDFSVDGDTFNVNNSNNSVGIGVATPNSSAVLEIASTEKGFLFPRMTEAQRNSLTASAVQGLMVYQTNNDEGIYIYKSFGWVQVI